MVCVAWVQLTFYRSADIHRGVKRVPRQTLMPFTRSDRVTNRQIRQRANGERVTPGPGRPARKRDRFEGHLLPMPHDRRPELGKATAVHVTLRCTSKTPHLRTKRRFRCIKRAVAKANRNVAFRVVHYAVLGNHLHVIVEADSKRALSKGVQTLALSISRSLNAQSVRACGGNLDPRRGAWSKRAGWLGKVFRDRYHSHELTTPAELAQAVRYVLNNALKHYGRVLAVRVGRRQVDAFCSLALGAEDGSVRAPRGFLFRRATGECDLRSQ